MDPAAHLVGAKVDLGEDALDRAPAHLLCDSAPDDLFPEILDRPLCSAVAQGHGLTGQGDDFKMDNGTVLRFVPRPGPITQACQTQRQKPATPALHGAGVSSTSVRDILGAPSLFARKDDPRPEGVPLSARHRSHSPPKLPSLLFAQNDEYRTSTPSHRVTSATRPRPSLWRLSQEPVGLLEGYHLHPSDEVLELPVVSDPLVAESRLMFGEPHRLRLPTDPQRPLIVRSVKRRWIRHAAA